MSSTISSSTGAVPLSADGLERVGLPFELYERIVAFVPDKHIAPLLRTSRTFFHLVGPRLYRSIELINFHRFDGTGLLDYIYSSAQDHRKTWLQTYGSGPSNPPPPPFDLAAVPHTTLPHLLTFTRLITVRFHQAHKCDGYPSISLPNLVTMRLEVSIDHVLCLPTPDKSLVTCPTIANLRPSHIILDASYDTSLAATLNGFWAEEYNFPPPWVKRLTFYIGEYYESPDKSVLHRLSASLEHLTLVLEPLDDLWKQWKTSTVDPQEGEPRVFLIDLARVCDSDAQAVDIVGMEMIDDEWLRSEGWVGTKEELVSRAKEEVISNIGVWPSAEREREGVVRRKKARVSFMTRKEYDERGGDGTS